MKNDPPRAAGLDNHLDDVIRRLIEADLRTAAGTKARSGLGALASALYQERRRRDAFFSPSLFAEPAWDILLALRAQSDTISRPSLSSLYLEAAAPSSTAHRHMLNLEREGLIERLPDTADTRCKRVRLTPRGSEAMQAYLAELALGRVIR